MYRLIAETSMATKKNKKNTILAFGLTQQMSVAKVT